jgi:hypothetical protein
MERGHRDLAFVLSSVKPSLVCVIGSKSAIEITRVAGRRVAVCHTVYSRVVIGDRVLSAIVVTDSAEIVTLPLSPAAARALVLRHLSDVPVSDLVPFVDRLTTPDPADPWRSL